MLGVPANASRELARKTFLQRLERVDYVPPPAWCAGLSALDDSAQAGGFQHHEMTRQMPADAMLRADLRSFCDDFWNLPPTERKVRYNELLQRSQTDAVSRHHLNHLRAGIAIPADAFDSITGIAGTLGRLLQTTFPLPPIQRAIERNATLAQLPNASAWRKAAQWFREEQPALADLDSELFRHIEKLPGEHFGPRPVRHYEQAPAKKSGNPGWIVFVIAMVVISLIRSAGSSSRTYPEPVSSYPTYNAPNYQYQPNYQFPKTNWQMQADERRRIEELINGTKGNSNPFPFKQPDALNPFQPAPKSSGPTFDNPNPSPKSRP